MAQILTVVNINAQVNFANILIPTFSKVLHLKRRQIELVSVTFRIFRSITGDISDEDIPCRYFRQKWKKTSVITELILKSTENELFREPHRT